MSAVIKSSRNRRALATLSMSAALVGGIAGVAEAAPGGATAPAGNHHTYSTVARVANAAQDGNIGPNVSATYSTWFFGRTQVCVQNISPTYDGSYHWSSSVSSGSRSLIPGDEYCSVRSYVGFPLTIENTSARATLHVRFPIGP
jgi:hypothetical protein